MATDDAWFGEPYVGYFVGEARTCNGMTVSGGEVIHSHDCPMHGPLRTLRPTDVRTESRHYDGSICLGATCDLPVTHTRQIYTTEWRTT